MKGCLCDVSWVIELFQVNEEASEKVLSIQQEYSRIRRPLYAQRNQVARLVPDFWKTALQNHPVVRDLITEDDESALIYLTDVSWSEIHDIREKSAELQQWSSCRQVQFGNPDLRLQTSYHSCLYTKKSQWNIFIGLYIWFVIL